MLGFMSSQWLPFHLVSTGWTSMAVEGLTYISNQLLVLGLITEGNGALQLVSTGWTSKVVKGSLFISFLGLRVCY